MDQKLIINDELYQVKADVVDEEKVALLTKAMEVFYDVEVEIKAKKEQEEIARFKMEKMFKKGYEEFGLTSIKGKFIQITFVPGTEGTTIQERVFSQRKAEAILQELGIDENDYYEVVERTTNKRKESIRVKVE